MGAFQYEAIDTAGRAQRGVLQADTVRSARGLLRERGLVPLSVDPIAEAKPRADGSWLPARRGLSRSALALLARQFATLAAAGLPIDEALGALAEQSAEGRTRAVVTQLRSRVMEGLPLAQALAEFPESFDDAFRAAVAAGEATGRLDQALLRLADQTEQRDDLRRKIGAALAYPALLTVVALTVVTGLLVYVVPQVVGVFDNLGQRLPWLTRALIALAGFVREWGLAVLVAVVVGGLGLRQALRNEGFAARVDAWRLRVPVVGRLERAANTANLARTLATLTGSGVPVLEAMQLAAGTLSNRPMRAGLRRASARVREGTGFARALEDSGVFAPIALRLVASGERSGKLDRMLDEAARHQQREVDTLLGTLTAVLGPAVILLVGALVLAIVLAILLPIFELNTLIR
jgi:general secretion pathway protein F